MSISLIQEYTHSVLTFDFKKPEAIHNEKLSKKQDEMETFIQRTVNLHAKSGACTLILFGLGSGSHALALAEALPQEMNLIVCETGLTTARDFLKNNPEWHSSTRKAVACDTSPWALLYLLFTIGITTENAHTALNPDLDEKTKNKFQSLQRLFISARPHQAINSSYLSHVAVQAPDLSVGVILHPEEPDLETFFAQFPDWIKEIVVIWDSHEVPAKEFRCEANIRHFAHPLEDFADQRNLMLEKCDGEWILYLDGDEMFSEDTWALFTALLLIKRLEACYFPRMTLYPDSENSKIGFGLWPDLQLRLFKNLPGITFDRPVHERLHGITGRTALAVDAPIVHFSRLRKGTKELTAKLERFDKAGGDRIHHILNNEYPSLKRSHFAEASFIAGTLQVMLLEENPV